MRFSFSASTRCRTSTHNVDPSIWQPLAENLLDEDFVQQRSSSAKDTEFAVAGQIALEVRFCVPKRKAVFLEQGMNLEPSLKVKEAPHLALRQGSGAIGLDSKRFKGLSRDVPPPAFESRRDTSRSAGW